MFRRVCSLLLITTFGIGILVLRGVFLPQWRVISHTISFHGSKLLDWNARSDMESAEKVDPYGWESGKEQGQFREPKVDSKSPYPVGRIKPAGSNYTRTLIVPKLAHEDTRWIQKELGDMLDSGLLATAIYVMDDPTAPLHPIQNKGREVMSYLSYIIDFYTDLPDVAIFMHAHRFAFHNNFILNEDGSEMLRRLSPERVTREGYMNLRCHWNPGCPDWMRPNDADFQSDKREQQVLAASWAELFPSDPLPDILAQPCCAQFAVSRERIHSIPRERFLRLRDWMLRTELDDFLSGRIFEYTWQYIFTASAFHCPSMSACYCDGYGVCFGDAEKFDYYFELEHYRTSYARQLAAGTSNSSEAPPPGPEREDWLRRKVFRIEEEMTRRKTEAIERGKNPQQRAKEAGRAWKEGDGF